MADIGKLINEIRTEFHIPPYFDDRGIENYINEGVARLDFLNPGRNYDKDLIYRMLLKNYVNYAYYGIVNEWEKNYEQTIVMWQMGSEVQS